MNINISDYKYPASSNIWAKYIYRIAGYWTDRRDDHKRVGWCEFSTVAPLALQNWDGTNSKNDLGWYPK